MNYTDEQLRLALAKMLPEKIVIEQDLSGYIFWWKDMEPFHTTDDSESIKDTEWLHVCWLVEQTLTNDPLLYGGYLHTMLNQGVSIIFGCSASWQQRATALAKVKGIEI